MATDHDTAQTQYENYRYCYDNGHEQWIQLARTCFEFWRGQQWTARDLAKLTREGRPALTFNIIESLVRAMKGMQRALRNDVRFVPVHAATTESAGVHDSVWLHVQNQNDLDFLESDIYEKGLIMGRAYYDVRVTYDESLQGHVKITGRRSQDVVLDPSIEDYDPKEWPQVFQRRWVSYNDILHLYGKDIAKQLGNSPMPSWYDYDDVFMAHQMGALPYYADESMGDQRYVRGRLLIDRQYAVTKRKDVFVDVETGDISEIPETWDHNRIAALLERVPGLSTMKHNVRTVKWDVTCEGVTCHSADSPYKHFTTVPFFPSFIDGVTKGAVDSLLDPQQLYNKMTSSELHIITSTANSGYKVKSGALRNMQVQELAELGSRPGIIVELDDVNSLEKFQPNQMPAGHDRLSFKADQIMRSIAGVSNQARGFAREDVAGEAIMANQAAQDINSAGWLANLHRTKQILARVAQDCVQAHYTETRMLMINRGTALVPQMESVTINSMTPEGEVLNDVTSGRYSTVLVPAPSRTTISEEDFKLLLELRKLGIGIPDAMLIELSPASNKAQIIKSLQGDSNERQAEADRLAAEQQKIDQQKQVATAKKEEAAALLNRARAEKFAIEAATDPDAAYERVEKERIAADAAIAADKHEIERDRLALEEQSNNRDFALRLRELDQRRQEAASKPQQRPAK